MSSTGLPLAPASEWKAVKHLPPIMTSFDKPLPPIKDKDKDKNAQSRSTAHVHARNRHMEKSTGTRPKDASTETSRVRDHEKSALRKESSKMSLFNLFSRPKVEKLRGYAEPGMSLPPTSPRTTRSKTPEPNHRMASLEVARGSPRPGTSMSTRSRKASLSPQELKSPTHDEPLRSTAKSNTWIPPPLFQAQAQSVRLTKARTADGPSNVVLSRRRRDSYEHMWRTDRSQRDPSIIPNAQTVFPHKIFALIPTGYVLQYTDQGIVQRLPEKILSLNSESVAFVCDLGPEEPFVLQVNQTTITKDTVLSSSRAILSKLGLRDSFAPREVTTLQLVLSSAEEIDAWLVAVRRVIQSSGSDKVMDKVMEEQEQAEEPNDLQKQLSHQSEQNSSDRHQKSSRYPHRGVSVAGSDVTTAFKAVETEAPVLRTDGSPSVQSKKSIIPAEQIAEGQALTNTAVSSASPAENQKSRNDTKDHTEQSRKRFPFKIRSSIYDIKSVPSTPFMNKEVSAATVITSLYSPMHTPRNTILFDRSTDDSDARPESVVADLPMLWAPQVLSRATTPTLKASPAIDAKPSTSGLRPLRTVEASNSRRLTSKQFALPLRLDTTIAVATPEAENRSVETTSHKSTPSTHSKTSEASSAKADSGHTTPQSQRPRRDSSAKLSLFPQPSVAPSAASIRPVVPVNSALRPLNRPSSLQVRSTTAPFLSSVRSSSGTHRPAIDRAESNPTLRSASAMGSTSARRISDRAAHLPHYSLSTSPADSSRVAVPQSRSFSPSPASKTSAPSGLKRLAHDRKESLTALPAPSGRPRTSRSVAMGLPALDLGIPVIGLAPPAPPPDRGLPSLPSASRAPSRLMAH